MNSLRTSDSVLHSRPVFSEFWTRSPGMDSKNARDGISEMLVESTTGTVERRVQPIQFYRVGKMQMVELNSVI